MELAVCRVVTSSNANDPEEKWVIRVRLYNRELGLQWQHITADSDRCLLFGSKAEAKYCKGMIDAGEWQIRNDNEVAVGVDWLAKVTRLHVQQINKMDLESQHSLLLQTIRILAERIEIVEDKRKQLDGTDTVILETLSEFGKEIVAQAISGNPLPDLMNPAWETARAALKSMCVERAEPFTPEVQKAWDALIHAHQAFVEIPKKQLHSHSLEEWVTAIHAAQAVLEHMALYKLYPNLFR